MATSGRPLAPSATFSELAAGDPSGGSWAAHPELGDAGPLCIEQHGRQLAAALLSENGGVVELQFVVKGAPPAALRKRLIDQVFARPEMRGRRPLQASLPLGDADLLDGLRRHCATWQSRAAGSTCLVDATIRDDPLVSAAEPAARPHSGRRHAGRHRATRTAAS